MTYQDFVKSYGDLLSADASAAGWFPEVVTALAVDRMTDDFQVMGNTVPFKFGNNVFAIPYTDDWAGDYMDSTGATGGDKVYRKYNTPQDSILDFFAYAPKDENGTFDAALAATDGLSQANAIVASVYPTDTTGAFVHLATIIKPLLSIKQQTATPPGKTTSAPVTPAASAKKEDASFDPDNIMGLTWWEWGLGLIGLGTAGVIAKKKKWL